MEKKKAVKPRVTLVFTLLFAAVLAAYLLFVDQGSELPDSSAGAPEPAHAMKIRPSSEPVPEIENTARNVSALPLELLPLDPGDELTWLQIQNRESGETMTFSRGESGWFLRFPLQYPAADHKVAALLKTLRQTRRLKRLEPEASWDTYGLQSPAFKIGIESRQSPSRRYLLLGDASPVGDAVFARWEDEDDYFLLPSGFPGTFDQSVYFFREKRLFRKPFSEATHFRLQTEAESYELLRQNQDWVWVKPDIIAGRRCSAESMASLWELQTGLFIKEYMDGVSVLSEDFGITNSGVLVRVSRGDVDSETVHVGSEAPVRDAYYVRREGEDVVALVSREHIRALFEFVRSMASEELLE